jgi:hypothetical protein
MKKIKLFSQILLVLFLLVGCSQEEDIRQEDAFLSKASSLFEKNTGIIPLNLVIDNRWDRSCFFQNDDSSKHAVYDEYANYMSNKFPQEDKIKKYEYTNIFLFSYEGKIVNTFGLVYPELQVNKKTFPLSVQDLYPHQDATMVCASAENLFLEFKENDQQVFVIIKKDLSHGN